MDKKRKLTPKMIKFSLKQIAEYNPYLIEYARLKHHISINNMVNIIMNLIDPIVDNPDLLDNKIRRKVIEKLLIKYLNTEIVDVYRQ